VKKMKKILIASLFVVLALGVFAGVAAAKSNQVSTQVQMGPLHDYMEKALAAKLNLPLATVESEFDAGKSLYQIALDHGIAQANVQTFMLEVRTQALKSAVADGVITQTQADRMLQHGGYGMGAGNCNGTGMRAGGGMMQRGGRWQQTNP
jgi:hypothetical protein